MALSPFQRDRNTEHGRIAATGAPEGSYVFELGNANRESGEFNVGDYVEVSQASIEFDGQASLARVTVNVALPETLPTSPALEWELTARLNGTARYTRRLRAELRSLELLDIAIPTVAATGGPTNTLAFRLALVSA
jgi:hypothetical protein